MSGDPGRAVRPGNALAPRDAPSPSDHSALRCAAAGLRAADLAGLRWARTAGHTRQAERAVATFSKLGEHAGVWLALGATGALRQPQRRAAWARATGTVAATYLLNTAIKLAVRRARPQLPDLPPLISTPTRLSFPSAHASSSFAGARAFAALDLPAAPLYALAGALALSRVYLGAHYPSDTAAGALLGHLMGGLAAP